MTGLSDLPNDVIWLILREVLFISYHCHHGAAMKDWETSAIFTTRYKDLTMSSFLRKMCANYRLRKLLKSKCNWCDEECRFSFIKGSILD